MQGAGRQAGRAGLAHGGLSLIEEAARRLFVCASVWERSCLPRYDDEGWIELYRHLLMLRSRLTFDKLVGVNIQHGEDQTMIQTVPGLSWRSSALCTNHVMMSGRHFAVFTTRLGSLWTIGVIRPVQMRFDLYGGAEFDPVWEFYWEDLRNEWTERWGSRWRRSNVNCCNVTNFGYCQCYDWINKQARSGISHEYDSRDPIGLLLDLDRGTLSLYQNGQRIQLLKVGLSGAYCWYASVGNEDASVSIERGSAPEE